jgi:DNA-binding transcriptional MocR family regulator
LRRGLVVGEVGRGTFVAGPARRSGVMVPVEPRGARIDLELNYPAVAQQAAMVAKSLSGLERPDVLEGALRQATSVGTSRMREVAAKFLARGAWSPAPDQMVFTANGRQCIGAALAALVPPGGRCGVEALSYPFIKSVAARLNITLVPLAMDDAGIKPEAITRAHRDSKLSAVYVQPVMQNPLGVTMTPQRRADILAVVEKHNLVIIEDAVYGFLSDEPTLASLAPQSCVLLDSLSKRIAPGLTLGFLVAPLHLRESVSNAVRQCGWTASGFAFAAAQRLMSDGTAAEIARQKRDDAKVRQLIAREYLSGFEIQSDPNSYHLWLTLPHHLRSQSFVAAAARQDIAITPSTAFAVLPGHAPNAVRLALASPPIDQLRDGLSTLLRILNANEQDHDFHTE